MAGRHFKTLIAVLPLTGMAILSALAFPCSLSAHACTPEMRWVDTLPDRTITQSRCLSDAVTGRCLSAVDTRPWTEDTLLQEILARSSRRAIATLVRIDSVRSTHRDSAYQVDGVAYVDRRMKEDAYLTVIAAYRGSMDTGRKVFQEAWNMGNVLFDSEYASFFPGRGRQYLAFFDPDSRLSALVLPATECDPELGGYELREGRIHKTGEGSFPGLSISMDRIVAALSASLGVEPGATGAAKARFEAKRKVGRPGLVPNPRLRDLRGRALRGGRAPGGTAPGSGAGHRGNLFDPGPETESAR